MSSPDCYFEILNSNYDSIYKHGIQIDAELEIMLLFWVLSQYSRFPYKKRKCEPGNMTQLLRALDALAEALFGSRTHMEARNRL